MNLAPKRRLLRFSLRTLFVVVTLLVIAAAWPAMRVAQRRSWTTELRARGALVVDWSDNSGHEPPKLWRIYGAVPVQWIELPSSGFSDGELAQVSSLFPEADMVRPAGPPFERPLSFSLLFHQVFQEPR
jgi:hypothetical protein